MKNENLSKKNKNFFNQNEHQKKARYIICREIEKYNNKRNNKCKN